MTTEIRIPKLSMSTEEAHLAEWLVADGAIVTEDTPLYALETDKSTQEVTAPASGTVQILAVAGETYPVGHLIGNIV